MFLLIQQYCTSVWHTDIGGKELFIRSLQAGSEQKQCVVPQDKEAMWTTSGSLWKSLRNVGEHRK